ncbi:MULTISPECIES: nuclease-related domain-containing protein [unclassified Lysinibacillus]|uniref:nuclease-related domain-containing protein n=1 Tax=unclassified Lysinibacillus TaxID=2636778 RepID=UPI003829E6D4
MLLIFLLIVIIMAISIIYFKQKNYRASTYYELTNDNMFKVIFDKGRYGEYLTSRIIEKYALKSHKQLLNVYIQKKNSNDWTEVDLVYIDRTGLYVIESKNYSGWIFGNENQSQWTQTMPNNKKFKFYNPIRQNATHIRAIQNFLGLPEEALHSVIVFSERCQLKKVEVTSENVHVLKRENVRRFIEIRKQSGTSIFSQSDIEAIYKKLLPQMQVSEVVKAQHLQTIQQKYKN